jgi:hypothetical protein
MVSGIPCEMANASDGTLLSNVAVEVFAREIAEPPASTEVPSTVMPVMSIAPLV